MGTYASTDMRGKSADQIIETMAQYFINRGFSLSAAFTMLDRDHSEFITLQEFTLGVNAFLESAGLPPASSSDLYRVFKRFDANGDNRISLKEFEDQYKYSYYASSKTWYEDDQRTRSVHFGFGGTSTMYTSSSVIAERRTQDLVARVASALTRQGITAAQLFQKLDLDHNRRLSWGELEKMILAFQPDLSVTERAGLFRVFDRDGSNEVDINEFCSVLEGANPHALVSVENVIRKLGDKFRASYHSTSWWEAFRIFDVNGDNCLTQAEFFRIMKLIGPDVPDNHLHLVFDRFDYDRTGTLDLNEFQNFFRDAIERCPSYSGDYYGSTTYTGMPGSVYGAPGTTVMPPAYTPVYEEAWEKQILDAVRTELLSNAERLPIQDVFRRLDIDGQLGLSMYEFNRIITTYYPTLAEYQVQKLFQLVNRSRSGNISLSEFVSRFG